ncbi:MAG: nucleotidyltransferase domain-containing protein [Bryobacteraceae bacterium]|nr:nucleotidyltransferase domain-containing protein [Bryobacteraceae bacterium]
MKTRHAKAGRRREGSGGRPATMARRMAPNRLIDEMVRRIVRQFHPERVILFGSHARGDAGPDSDVDLLVVMPVEGSRSEKEIEIRVALHDIGMPKDIIVTTPEDFAWRKEIVGTIEHPAVKEGEVLYARG